MKSLGSSSAGAYNRRMADLLVLILVLGFFGVCVAFVYGCDRIIGPDDDADLDDADLDDTSAEDMAGKPDSGGSAVGVTA